MIVIDASALIDVLLPTDAASAVSAVAFRKPFTLHAPHLIDLEVSQVLRRFASRKQISVERAGEALTDFAAIHIERHPHFYLLSRIWELRDNFTTYDAAYIALAEILDAPLLTRDHSFTSTLHHARVIVV